MQDMIGKIDLQGHGDKQYSFDVYTWNANTKSFAGVPVEGGGIFFVGELPKTYV